MIQRRHRSIPDARHIIRGVVESTVYPKKYAHGFVVLCFVVVMQSFIMNSHEVFIHIHRGCFAGTGAIVTAKHKPCAYFLGYTVPTLHWSTLSPWSFKQIKRQICRKYLKLHFLEVRFLISIRILPSNNKISLAMVMAWRIIFDSQFTSSVVTHSTGVNMHHLLIHSLSLPLCDKSWFTL